MPASKETWRGSGDRLLPQPLPSYLKDEGEWGSIKEIWLGQRQAWGKKQEVGAEIRINLSPPRVCV